MMPLTPEIDFIVVGQGIAGSCLAYELLERGARTIVYDDGWKSAACTVAAGVINPITGKRLVKSWRSAVAHPYARDFYQVLERRLGGVFFTTEKFSNCVSRRKRQNYGERAPSTPNMPRLCRSLRKGNRSETWTTLSGRIL